MKLYTYSPSTTLLPKTSGRVPAGFPSPAEGFEDKPLSLDDLLITHPNATIFVKMEGDSMIEALIDDGDVAIVDKSLTPKHNDIVLAYVDGSGYTIKRLVKHAGNTYLAPANKKYKPMLLTEFVEVRMCGVITGITRKYK